MISQEILSKIEDYRQKGWYFDLKGDKTGWECYIVGKGLAHGRFSHESLQIAVEQALIRATDMVDDPEVFIKAHGEKIAQMAKEAFGQDNFAGLEPVEWEPGEPCRLSIKVRVSADATKTVDAESAFYSKAMEVLPQEVFQALTFEFDWPEDKQP